MNASATGHRPFRFGVQLQRADSASAWVNKARHAEEIGYSIVTMPDHVSSQPAPIPALTAIALSTTKIRLGPMVMSNDWRNPVLLAREAATLDWLSNGRLEFGLGAGWQSQDYERLGLPFDSPGVRVDRMAEALGIIRDLLSGNTVTCSGRYYRLVDATCYPSPVQTPHPPLVVGGGSRRILSLAGRLADIVNVHTNLGASQRGATYRPDLAPDSARERVRWIREGAGARFAELELGFRIFMTAVTDQRSSAAAELGSRWQLSADEVLESPYALIGSVDSIADELVARREQFGTSHFLWNESELKTMAPVVRRLSGR
jgi:probable F420-dependent oxidoreductase